MVVLSYHSLEDRITKQAIAPRARASGPVDLPVELPGTGPTLRLLTRGAELPGEAEVAANPRAASVRLRAVERIDEHKRTQVRALHQPTARRGGARSGGRQPGGGGAPPMDQEEGEGR
jgi:16S rRNA (cytosine1402-N4)-methyltransferase